jgi:carbon storage regulator
MLVLSRKKSEGLVIGEGIRIQVLGIRGKRIRLGIEAPREVPIRRLELPLNRSSQPATIMLGEP